MIVAPGTTSLSIDVFFADDSGAAVTGKVAADFPACKWSGGNNTADTTITLSDLAAITTVHPNNNTAGGIKEREGGWYRLDIPNNVLTSVGTKTLTFAEVSGKRIVASQIDVRNVQVGSVTGTFGGISYTTLVGYIKNTAAASYLAAGAVDINGAVDQTFNTTTNLSLLVGCEVFWLPGSQDYGDAGNPIVSVAIASGDYLVTLGNGYGIGVPVSGDAFVVVPVPINDTFLFSGANAVTIQAFGLSSPTVPSLQSHMAAQVSTRLGALLPPSPFTGGGSTLSADGLNHVSLISGGTTRNFHLWEYGVDNTCIPVSSGESQNGILITPQHMIVAAHTIPSGAPSYGPVTFVDNAGVSYTRSYAAGATIHGDLALVRLSSPLPSGITPARVLPPNFRDYFSKLGTGGTGQEYIGVSTNQDRTLLVAAFSDTTEGATSLWGVGQSGQGTYSPWWYNVRTGDSGSPFCAIINGFLVALGCWYDTDTGPVISDWLTQIQAQIVTWGDPYTIATADLSAFSTKVELADALVRITQGGNTQVIQADSTGTAAYTLSAGNYMLSVSKMGYTFTPVLLTISANVTIEADLYSGFLPAPVDSDTTVGYLYVRDNTHSLASGITVQVGRTTGAGIPGSGLRLEPQVAVSAASPLGLVSFQLAKGGTYAVRVQGVTGEWGAWVNFTAAQTDSFAIAEALGPGYAL